MEALRATAWDGEAAAVFADFSVSRAETPGTVDDARDDEEEVKHQLHKATSLLLFDLGSETATERANAGIWWP